MKTILEAASFLAAAISGNDGTGSAPIAPDADGPASVVAPEPSCHVHTIGNENQLVCIIPSQEESPSSPGASSISSGDPSSHIRSAQRALTYDDVDGRDLLESGTVVELWGEGAHFAPPAIITGHSLLEDLITYDLHMPIVGSHASSVDPQFVHPYQVYEDGTEASCNIGNLRKRNMIPCTVDTHFVGGSGPIMYEVSWLRDSRLVQTQLPFSKVQRVLTHKNGNSFFE
mmetsp:Transcript_31492/g.67130  ORF Transcript_31492/g.67130 Transcript_31492/m.67130 type:complete len:229 (+) Transcript_31492:222-908(+)|eukprot:CAMPEP_0172535432 /NCGR_PEP_ID=MMETSP1067-20121228/7443_1 /TAXON_ID=265564 ORGANISM="Thalassiosira punctigera, Strain Tpunct2005C2" /NCGR_SAMPLE_ID=MMETSP1067 /ASSEMBLY_ACC=CAM_ASM_000444 /LENGTH=228 /DNA_ID=CAMNT_0013320365 /DNA_START=115 /DNA_END=801 /DNA_ORIENTATION=-